jgi:hypothetical protein
MSMRIWQCALWVLIGESWYHGPPGAIAPKIDPADADEEDVGASAPNVAVGAAHGRVVEMVSTAASADRRAGSDTATDDDDDDASADSDFFAAVQMSSAVEVAHRAVVHREVVHRIGVRRWTRRVGEGEDIIDHHVPRSVMDDWDWLRRHKPVRARLPKVGPRRSSVAPTGYYYYTAGSATYIQNPAGPHGAAGAKLSALDPHGAPAGYFYKAGASAYLEDPAGTYSPAGASAPIADPGGTYSAAGASAPTTDPPGTYSSPYALTRLFLDPNPTTPATGVLSFNSASAVANYYGATSFEAGLANQFFAGYAGAPATMLFTRYSAGGARPHLYGANLVGSLTPKDLQNISGSLSITFQGLTWPVPITYSAQINLSADNSFPAAAKTIQSALNSNLQTMATTESKIDPVYVQFTGSIIGDLLTITSAPGGSIKLGAEISGPQGPIGQIVTQRTGTSCGIGLYTLFAKAPTVSSETMTESYGVLTVGAVTSGTVAVGEKVTGAGVQTANPITAIDANISGSGSGSKWLVNNAQTVPAENMTMTATPLVVNYISLGGATEPRNFFEIQPNGQFGYDYNQSTLSFASGTLADELYLTQASYALDSFYGGRLPAAPAFMNNLVQSEYSQFGSFQATWETLARLDPNYLGDLAEWAQSTGYLYTFLNQWTNTTSPAGSSLPMADPPGTYSGPGASAPTIDPPGTYSGAGASAPTEDPAGTYSLAGASAPTLAHAGYYVPTAGASSKTPDDAGYYTPYPGATAEILLPAISGAVAGRAMAFNQTDAPFTPAIEKSGFGLYNDFTLEGWTEARGFSHYVHGRSYIT